MRRRLRRGGGSITLGVSWNFSFHSVGCCIPMFLLIADLWTCLITYRPEGGGLVVAHQPRWRSQAHHRSSRSSSQEEHQGPWRQCFSTKIQDALSPWQKAILRRRSGEHWSPSRWRKLKWIFCHVNRIFLCFGGMWWARIYGHVGLGHAACTVCFRWRWRRWWRSCRCRSDYKILRVWEKARE